MEKNYNKAVSWSAVATAVLGTLAVILLGCSGQSFSQQNSTQQESNDSALTSPSPTRSPSPQIQVSTTPPTPTATPAQTSGKTDCITPGNVPPLNTNYDDLVILDGNGEPFDAPVNGANHIQIQILPEGEVHGWNITIEIAPGVVTVIAFGEFRGTGFSLGQPIFERLISFNYDVSSATISNFLIVSDTFYLCPNN